MEVAGGVGKRGGSAGEEVVDGAAAVAGGPSAVGFAEGVEGGGDAGGCEAGGEPAAPGAAVGVLGVEVGADEDGAVDAQAADDVDEPFEERREEPGAAGAAG